MKYKQIIITKVEACTNDKVQLDQNLDCAVAALEESKREHAQRLQDVITKERQNANKADVNIEVSLLNMKEM